MAFATLNYDLSDPIQKKEYEYIINCKKYQLALMDIIVKARSSADKDGNLSLTKFLRDCAAIATEREIHADFVTARDYPIT